MRRATLPKSLEEIGARAFQGYVSLKSAEIPKSVKIGKDAFKGCRNLRLGKSYKILGISIGSATVTIVIGALCNIQTGWKFWEGVKAICKFLKSLWGI